MVEYVKFSDIVDPNYAKVKNDIQYARTTENPGTQVFTYMESCTDPSVEWGSGNKPIDQQCLPNHLHMQGTSCNSIWNNSTKRKTVVNPRYIYPR